MEVLVRKPGAVTGATGLSTARASGASTATHQRFWEAARKALGDSAGPGRWSGHCCCTAPWPLMPWPPQ